MLFSANVKRCASVGYIIPSHKTLNTGLLINCASKSGDSPLAFILLMLQLDIVIQVAMRLGLCNSKNDSIKITRAVLYKGW